MAIGSSGYIKRAADWKSSFWNFFIMSSRRIKSGRQSRADIMAACRRSLVDESSSKGERSFHRRHLLSSPSPTVHDNKMQLKLSLSPRPVSSFFPNRTWKEKGRKLFFFSDVVARAVAKRGPLSPITSKTLQNITLHLYNKSNGHQLPFWIAAQIKRWNEFLLLFIYFFRFKQRRLNTRKAEFNRPEERERNIRFSLASKWAKCIDGANQ